VKGWEDILIPQKVPKKESKIFRLAKFPEAVNESREWTCSICLTRNNEGPYCKKCLPEEHEKWKDKNGL